MNSRGAPLTASEQAERSGAVERVFREESTRILASLIRVCGGDFELAEDAVQDALIEALQSWPEEGVPSRPAAWITTVARRRAIDRIRRSRRFLEKSSILSDLLRLDREEAEERGAPDHLEEAMRDDRLRLMFTCCHPALSMDAQVALTLKTVAGLSTREIARAFLVQESTLAQRLVRAKRKIKQARIPYRVPAPEQLPDRLDAVLNVVYLIFNEAYLATDGEHLMRSELSQEAIRLARLVVELVPDASEALGLLALLILHDARRYARADASGALVPLEEQDRARWDRDRIRLGLSHLHQAMRSGTIGPFQLQAAIAALHATSRSAEETDWPQIAALYTRLYEWTRSPVVALNRAVAVAMADGYEEGLHLIDALEREGALSDYPLLHAARADLLRRLGNREESLDAYRRARAGTTNPAERDYLDRRIREIESGDATP